MSILRRIESALRRTDEAAFVRADFSRFGGYAQVSRALQAIVAKGLLVRVGHGAYVKSRPADDGSGEPVPVLPVDEYEAQIEIKRAVATRKARKRE